MKISFYLKSNPLYRLKFNFPKLGLGKEKGFEPLPASGCLKTNPSYIKSNLLYRLKFNFPKPGLGKENGFETTPRAGRGLGWGCAAIQKDLNIYLYIKNNSINNKSNVLDGCENYLHDITLMKEHKKLSPEVSNCGD